MARIRTIKPEFWTNPQVVRVIYPGRLLFIGTWNFADDHGNLPRDAEKLKLQVFPGDDIDVEPLIQSLIDQGLLIEYTVNTGERFLHIPTFLKHQKINRPSEPVHPLPDKAFLDSSQGEKNPDSVSTREGLTEGSSLARARGKGKEGKGKGVNLKTKSVKDICQPAVDLSPGAGSEVAQIFDYWRERMQSPRAVLSAKRTRLIAGALKAHTPADLCKAIRGCSKDPWHMGANDNGRVYNSIELILRDEKHIEQFIAYDVNPPQPVRTSGPASRQERRRETARAFGFVPRERDDATIDLAPEDVHVVTAKP